MRTASLVLIITFSIAAAALANDGSPEPLRVGVSLPLTGPLAGMGQAFRRGIEFYQSRIHTRAVDFIYEDHKYEGKTAVSGIYRLHDVERVDLAFVWGNTPAGSCAPVAEQLSLPLIVGSMNPDAKGRRHVVSFGPIMEDLIAKIHEQFQSQPFATAGALSIDIGNALQGVEMLKGRLDGKLLTRTIANDEADFKTVISDLKSKNVDTLLLFTLPDQTLTFLKQSRQMRYSPFIVGGDIFADTAFQRNAAELTAKLTFVYGAVKDDFLKAAAAKYGDVPYFFETAMGYTLALLADALAVNPSTRETDLLDLLGTIDVSNAPLPNLRFLADEQYGRHLRAEVKAYGVPVRGAK